METGGRYQRRTRPIMVYPSTSSGRVGQNAFVAMLSLAKHRTTNVKLRQQTTVLKGEAKATAERRFSDVVADPETPSSPR
jgi:hypothetical protein